MDAGERRPGATDRVTRALRAFIAIVASAVVLAAEPPVPADRAEAFLRMLEKEDFASVEATFSADVARALPEDKLAGTWKGLIAQTGKLRSVDERRTGKQGALTIVDLLCTFEAAPLVVRVVYDDAGKVSGLWFKPIDQAIPKEGEAPKPPALEKNDRFAESEVTVGKAPWELPGVLTLPAGKGPWPAVLLVAGSGPNDRDETIGPNKPFREIAFGLAEKGIATLRYDKRTRAHGAEMAANLASLTIEDEVLADAAFALALLRTRKEIDPARVFVLGHSLGGTCAPLIARADGKLAGMILLAGSPRSLVDLVAEQLAYIGSLGSPSDADKAQIQEILDGIDKLKKGQIADDATVMGMTPHYLHDLDARDTLGVAKALALPALVLQGGRDYQVTEKDFEIWKGALSGKPGTELKLYPDLNHCFATGKGRAVPEEYAQPQHVAAEVIADVAAWIQKRSPRR